MSDNTESLYTADYFEKDEDTKSGYTNYLSSPVANIQGKFAFARLFSEPGNHIDLGCANGSLIEIFESNGFKSRGFEISKDAVKIAKDKGLNVEFSTLDSFPKGTPKSRIITAFDLLEHADKPGNVLREVYANLEEDGYFVFSTLCVKHDDPSDYWYNNSLEHYVYYNQENLTYILENIFGKGNFSFVEIEVNGVSEFWGFAKKGKPTWEKKVIGNINDGSFDKQDSARGYLVGLFYNQLSKFAETEAIIDHFKDTWPKSIYIQAVFFNLYQQGKLELALEKTRSHKSAISTKNPVFWQALAHAEEAFFEIKERDIISESNNQIIVLRDENFRLSNEIHILHNTFMIGKLLKLRKRIKLFIKDTRQFQHDSYYRTRHLASRILPSNLKKLILKILRFDYRDKLAKSIVVSNKQWSESAPLVSVIIPYYNRADTIDDTLQSLAVQTYRDFEIIIVDDGSTDTASVDKLITIQESGLDAQIIHQKNQGVSAARNNGIKASNGKYIICLDSDDVLESTFIEKCTLILETSPEISLVTTHRDDFGVVEDKVIYGPYDPLDLYINNMVITAAQFRKDAWRVAGGYKSGIGYEDWDFWLTLGEKGFWGRLLPEHLFLYRTSMQSRFIEDKGVHWNNIQAIRSLHPKYKSKVRKLLTKRQYIKETIAPETAFINVDQPTHYAMPDNGKQNILITIPWMTFGGAETLIYNFCREIKDNFNIIFVTGLKSEHQWEYKFREISPYIYHMANLFDDPKLHELFIANLIKTKKIQALHIIHNGFTFSMLEYLKQVSPDLKVAVTMFNDRVEYFEQSVDYDAYIDTYTSDNSAVANHYKKLVGEDSDIRVIPNGINSVNEFNLKGFDRTKERAALQVADNELAVFFVGRLSEEKNPDVFLEAAKELVSRNPHLKFFIIGDGGMRGKIEKGIKEIGSKQIVYLGYQTEIARYLSSADIFVLPSSIEGFPLSILEAMSMKVAVVASDVGAVREVLEDGKGGFVITPGSAAEIVEVIERLQDDRALLERVKANGRKKVEQKYSNIVLGENYTKLYSDLTK